MKFAVGEAVRVIRGDLRGRTGVIHRVPSGRMRGGSTYGVEFAGEVGASQFRASNLETTSIGAAIPEFMVVDGAIHPLGDEPYQVISGGLMGKRRRYRWSAGSGTAPFGAKDEATETCDFRRFPIESKGTVIAGLWSRFTPGAIEIESVKSRLGTTRDSRATEQVPTIS